MNTYGSGSRKPGCDQLEPPTCTSRLKHKVLYHVKTEDIRDMALWKEYVNANNDEKPIRNKNYNVFADFLKRKWKVFLEKP